MSSEERTITPTRAFLEVRFQEGDWDLPLDVQEVLSDNEGCDPTCFFLPWPVEAVPPVGATLNFDGLSVKLSPLTVESLEYDYTEQRGVTVFVQTSEWNPATFGMGELVTCAQQGFVTEDPMEPLTDVLKDASLPSTWEEYQLSQQQ